MYTLSAQVERRDFEETRRRLDQARELIISFAMVNGRLPCPARDAASTTVTTALIQAIPAGGEVRDAPTPTGSTTGGSNDCTGITNTVTITDYYGGTNGGVTLGLLPARALGLQQVDAAGFAVDAWNNRIRYAVANLITNCSGTSTTPHFVNATNLRANGISCQPDDLLICRSATGITATTCGGAANQVMTQSLVVAIVYSLGKNGALTPAGLDEQANPNGDRIFVYHTPTPATAANGEFDDQFTWITVGELYGRMIMAGQLP